MGKTTHIKKIKPRKSAADTKKVPKGCIPLGLD